MAKRREKNPADSRSAEFQAELRRIRHRDRLILCTSLLVAAAIYVFFASGSFHPLVRLLDTQGFSSLQNSTECRQAGSKPSYCTVEKPKAARRWRELDSVKVPFSLND
jgi:hypothetical protein